MKLLNKVAIITGGSDGLGKSLAKKFISKGCQVIITGKNKNKLLVTAKEIGATPFWCDASNWKQMQNLTKFTIKKYKKINIWVNNAGISKGHAPIIKTNLKEAHKIINTNFFGIVHGSLLALKNIKNGAIINIISTSALNGRPKSSIYAASKWAARGFTESLNLAIKNKKLKIMSIYPGGMKTNLFGSNRPSDYKNFLEPNLVAKKIVSALIVKNSPKKMIIKRKYL
ncbi:MAG: SDR family oxidoreductase [Candidatus Magasanikbacteria bacterium]